MKKIFKDYLHQDDAYDLAEDLGYTEGPAAEAIANWAYEVEFELEFDDETNQVTILKVDGKEVAK